MARNKNTAPRYGRRRAVVGGLGLILVAGGVTGVTAAANPELAGDVKYHAGDNRTPLENRLTDGINSALDIDVRVRCEPASPDAKPDSHANVAVTSTESIWFLPGTRKYMRVHPLACAALGNVIDADSPRPNNDPAKVAESYALYVFTKQGEQVAHPDARTDEIACYTLQQNAKVARHLGATQKVAIDLGSFNLAGHTTAMPPELQARTNCQEESYLDLNLHSPGFFPAGEPQVQEIK